MMLYGVKDTPEVIVKYILRNGEQKTITFGYLTEYCVDTKFGVVVLHFRQPDSAFFTDFKMAVLKNQIVSCTLNAMGFRHNFTTNKDETYCELKDLYCKKPFISYDFSNKEIYPNFYLQFPIWQGDE